LDKALMRYIYLKLLKSANRLARLCCLMARYSRQLEVVTRCVQRQFFFCSVFAFLSSICNVQKSFVERSL